MKIENIPNIYQAGDQAVIVVFEETISPEINLQVHSLKTTIENYGFEEIIELVPGYASLLVGYDANLVSSEEIHHDKNKKIINYKNAWLKVYDKPILYFPKFFHPDPTVKRQSGFLIPAFSSSNNLGNYLFPL